MALSIGSGAPPIYPNRNPRLEAQEPELRESPPETSQAAIAPGEELEENERIRDVEHQETNSFPTFDEVTTVREKRLEEDSGSILLSVSITKDRILKDPNEAAGAQANLSPQNLLKLLEG